MEPPDDKITLGIAKLRRKRHHGVDDVIFGAARIVARAMTLRDGSRPGWEWMFGLEDADFGRVVGAIDALDALIRWDGDIDVQLVPVASKCALRALLVHDQIQTKPLTILGLMEGETLWIATGHMARGSRLTESQIAVADNIAAEWMATRR
jgi:hypothetical protein